VLASERDFPRALHEADTAVAFGPYDGIMHAHLSQLLITAGEVKKGMEWNELAHPQDPGGLSFQNYNRGLGLRLLGKYEESMAAFKQSGYPDGDTPLHIAIALVRLGRIDEAKAEVKVVLKNDPKFTQAKWRASWSYSDPSIMDREVADLAKADLPEK
jgi:tetratricopeptide (TPR) repeat protein